MVTAQADDAAVLAAAAYEAGRFGEAIQLYESMVVDGRASGAVYFNLGNTYFHTGQIGRALLNYRRAQRQLPRDPDIDAAIARVISLRRDVIGDDPRLLAQVASLTSAVMTQQELAWATLMCWGLFCGLLVVAALMKTVTRPLLNAGKALRVDFRQLIMAVALALTMLLALLGVRMAFEALQPSGVVVVDQVTVLSGPGADYLHLYDLFEAAEVYVLEQRTGWTRFGLADGRQGWVVTDALEVVNP